MSVMIVDATAKHTASIIFSHGLGDSAAGWYPFAQSMKRRFPHVKWILPTAPNSPVTLNGGMRMNSWFDIMSLTPPVIGQPSLEDEKGMLASVRTLSELVRAEVEAGIPSERIVVGGFSQGAVISLLAGITSERKLAGLISMSGFLGLSSKIKSMQTEHAHKLPIFWGHGTSDMVVKYQWGVDSQALLVGLGFSKLEFHSYPRMAHSVCGQEEKDLEAYLTKIIPAVN